MNDPPRVLEGKGGDSHERKDCTVGDESCQVCVFLGEFSAHFHKGNWCLYFRREPFCQLDYLGEAGEYGSRMAAAEALRLCHLLRETSLKEWSDARARGDAL